MNSKVKIEHQVCLLKELNWTDKVLLSMVMDNKYGFTENNESIANDLNLTKDSVNRILHKLEKEGFIERKLIYKEGTKQIEKRIIKLSNKLRQIMLSN